MCVIYDFWHTVGDVYDFRCVFLRFQPISVCSFFISANLGIEMPMLANNYIPPGMTVHSQSENGFMRLVNKLHIFFYHTLKLKICNRLRKWLYCHTYSNPSRKHSEVVHLRETDFILILLSYKSCRFIFLLQSYFLRTIINKKYNILMWDKSIQTVWWGKQYYNMNVVKLCWPLTFL